jgi:hypothetical protein
MEPEFDIHEYVKPKIKATQRQGNTKRNDKTESVTEYVRNNGREPETSDIELEPNSNRRKKKNSNTNSSNASTPRSLLPSPSRSASPLSLSQVYHPRQSPNGDNCRLHALNAFFGFQKLSLGAFNKYSDEFDKLHKLHIGATKTYFILPKCDGDKEDNIFSFIIDKLTKGKFATKYFPMRSEEVCDFLDIVGDSLEGFIEFTESHVWYTRKSGNYWFIIDCIEKRVKQARNNPLDTGLGHVLIWNVTSDKSSAMNLVSECNVNVKSSKSVSIKKVS